MGRVSTLLDVGTPVKVAVAVVAVALLAFGATASPAWAQDTTLEMNINPDDGNVLVGQEATIEVGVRNIGGTEAQNVMVYDTFVPQSEAVFFAPDSFSVSASQDTCDFITIDNVPPLPPTYVVACRLGDLPVWEEGNVGTQATITIKLVPTTTGLIRHQAIARAENAPSVEEFGDLVVDRASSPPPGGEPGGDSGDRVLVEHKGKELCLPEAALKGHLKHGDEVLDEEGCSDTDQGSRGGSKK